MQRRQQEKEARAAPPLIRPCQVARKARLGAVGDESKARVPCSGRSRRVPRTGTREGSRSTRCSSESAARRDLDQRLHWCSSRASLRPGVFREPRVRGRLHRKASLAVPERRRAHPLFDSLLLTRKPPTLPTPGANTFWTLLFCALSLGLLILD